MSAPELKPCPFCGGHAVREARMDCSIVRCVNRNDGCPVNMRTHKHPVIFNAEIEWNTRATSEADELRAENERLRGVLEIIAYHRTKCLEYDEDIGHPARSFDEEDVKIMEYAARAALKESRKG